MWLFHLHSAVENTAFFPVFPLAGYPAKVFSRLFLWSFKEASINHFYNTAFKKESAIFYDAAFLLWKGFGNIWWRHSKCLLFPFLKF